MPYSFGDIVLLRFPYSDGAGSKKRPALVLSEDNDGDLLVCRITSQPYHTAFDVSVSDFRACGLLTPSVIRVHKMATLERRLVEKVLGGLDAGLMRTVATTFRQIVV